METFQETCKLRFLPDWRNPELVVPGLVTALREEDSQVHDDALNGLIKFGPAANTAVPALIVMLKEMIVFIAGALRVCWAQSVPVPRRACPPSLMR